MPMDLPEHIFRADMDKLAKATLETTKLWTRAGLSCPCKVLDCYDGDSMTVAIVEREYESPVALKVRLMGVDTPELHPRNTTPNRDLHAQAGQAARRWVRLRLEGRPTALRCAGEDSFGRTLADILFSDRPEAAEARRGGLPSQKLADEMIAAGVGKAYGGSSKKPEWTAEDLQRVIDAPLPDPSRWPAADPSARIGWRID